MTHRARKRFGQNFLHDHRVINDIVSIINARPNDHIVEIGPGKGALTRELAGQCQKMDLIELDRDLVKLLDAQFGHLEGITIHSADALSINYTALAQPDGKLRIIGNLPYNVSSPLLFHLVKHASSIHDMHFMLQNEVVNRLCALPGGKIYGKLSIMMQYHCRAEKLFEVGAENFSPQPKVSSAIVRLVPHQHPQARVENFTIFQELVAQAFSQRRKTLRNAIRCFLSEDELRSLDIDPGTRPETLTVREFAQLSNLCNANRTTS